MRSWDIRTSSLLSYKTNLIKSIIIQLNWCISQCKDYIQNSRPAKTVIFQIVGENGTNVQLFLSFSSFDEFPVWYEFVKRNVSSIYRHEVTSRMKRDGKRRKFARKNLGRDLRGYLASTPTKSPPVWVWIPFSLQTLTSCWDLENKSLSYHFRPTSSIATKFLLPILNFSPVPRLEREFKTSSVHEKSSVSTEK